MASTYLTRTPSSAGNRKTCTFSAWVKRGNIGNNTIIGCYSANNDNDTITLTLRNNGQLRVSAYNVNWRILNRLFRDTNAWYHIVLTIDTTQSTANDRIKVYVNGVQETSFSTINNPSQNADIGLNQASTTRIGAEANVVQNHFDGLMSHVHFIDGTAYDASAFGETDSTSGIWKIKTSPSVSYGTNGFFILKDGNNLSGSTVQDQSGQSNNWTVGGGTLTDLKDNPANVYPVWNKLDWGTNYSTLSNGNTTAQSNASAYPPAIATLGVDSGKWYWEIKYAAKDGGDDYPIIGITSTQATAVNNELGEFANDWGYYTNNTTPYYRNNGSQTSYGTAYTVGDIIGVAVDLENNKLYFSKNGTWQNSGVPTSGSTGTGAIAITDPASTPLGFYFPAVSYFDGSQRGTFHANFGNGYFGTTAITSAGSNGNGSLFEYDVPSGYYALNTKNLNTYG
jgi:hypothetical protein